MKLPLSVEITQEKDIIIVTLKYPNWNIKSLVRWIFKKTVVYENWVEYKYKLK